MTGRVGKERDLLRTAYRDLDCREEGGVYWVRLPSYPVPPGWTPGRVEVCFQIPAMAGQAPYAFRVRPQLVRADGGQPGNYTYPVATPWGADWGQFSWSPVEWVPKADIRAGANMLNFARRLRQVVICAQAQALDIRRAQPAIAPVLHFGDLTVDTGRRLAWRTGCQLDLAPKEFGVLEVLLAAGGRAVPAEELLERVWDQHADPFTAAVKITVSRLRAKLGDPPLISTVPRCGYQIGDPA